MDTEHLIEAERLNRAADLLWPGAMAGSLWNIDMMLKIEERRARMLGLID